ncbi:GNAT family N-acetyltransferase [Cellulomonas chengniuliangii]|uniref:GNAT family N-acetyltransferase n=1 Tax=Cellulomonas chengniuliangii TaxID=2968084 RepID=A0ABY5KZR2_9CELL|nr:GNAT family N-acetyltransferase [Cellulomonas chengniuliangii]MCC2308486.1 GNAT family N-acetyltransferase [Cellulomonas chengniuliangii]UUI73853.1 GNAT family N-acetyltransferase [Cellulomonas chengniuliangii]
MVRVEQLSEDEWEVLRDIRLRALWQSPQAFGASLARDQRFQESHWRMRLRSSHWFVARTASEVAPVGLVCMITEPGSPVDDRHVVSLWVDPGYRSQGIGGALLRRVADEAVGTGATTLSLWVVDDNDAACALYTGFGFVPTGASQPHPRDPARSEVRFECALQGH